MINSGKFLLHFRLRYGLSQKRMADLLGVAPGRIALWERGLANPGEDISARLIDLMQRLPGELLSALGRSVEGSLLPRALSRSSRLNLQVLSGPAIAKRPDIVDWIDKDLAPIACGVLQSVLLDGALQRAIKNGEISRVVTTTRSVLRTGGAQVIGTFRTTVNYVFHDGVMFSDAMAVPAHDDERLGYTAIPHEELGADLFGDLHLLEAGLVSRSPPRRAAGG